MANQPLHLTAAAGRSFNDYQPLRQVTCIVPQKGGQSHAMAIPKRHRRVIVVDGVRYHWTRGRTPENMWVTAQLASGQGSLLRIDLYGVPTPADIAEAIRFAITHGWSPMEQHESFYLGFTDQRETERFVVRSAGSPDFWREFEPR